MNGWDSSHGLVLYHVYTRKNLLYEGQLSYWSYRGYFRRWCKTLLRGEGGHGVIVSLLKDRVEVDDAPDSKRARTKKYTVRPSYNHPLYKNTSL